MKKLYIEKLVPQRAPILMVDELLEADDGGAVTCLTIRSGNLFVDVGGVLEEVGLIEHIAQSASALAGYKACVTGRKKPPVGYIGEIKRFHCYRCPCVGDELHTKIVLEAEVNGVTLVRGECHVGEEVVADTQMKIFIQPDE